jgi:hypothetical protein
MHTAGLWRHSMQTQARLVVFFSFFCHRRRRRRRRRNDVVETRDGCFWHTSALYSLARSARSSLFTVRGGPPGRRLSQPCLDQCNALACVWECGGFKIFSVSNIDLYMRAYALSEFNVDK